MARACAALSRDQAIGSRVRKPSGGRGGPDFCHSTAVRGASRDDWPCGIVTFVHRLWPFGPLRHPIHPAQTAIMALQPYVCGIASLRIGDTEDAGGKGANLGELVAAKLPVPPGFVLVRAGYLDSMQAGGVDAELSALHREALTRVAESACLSELCHRMQNLVTKAGEAQAVCDQVLDAYHRLVADTVVAVRSSATGEEGRDASSSCMCQTITNVMGADALIDAVQQCWMSVFTPRVIIYRASRGFAADPAMAVVIQHMVAPSRRGRLHFRPKHWGRGSRGRRSGLWPRRGRGVAARSNRTPMSVTSRLCRSSTPKLRFTAFKIVRGPDGHDTTVELDYTETEAQVLDEDSLRRIVELAIATERHNRCPQDAEWATSSGTVWLVQARPVTPPWQRHSARRRER